MPFRDDRDALRERAESLEAERDAMRHELERVKAGAAHSRDVEQQLAAVRAQLEQLEAAVGARPNRAQTTATTVIGICAATAAGLGLATALEVCSEPAVPVDQQIVEQASQVGRASSPVSRPEPAGAEVPTRTLQTSWTAKVTSAKGVALAPGSPCEITATLRVAGSARSVDRTVVVCGGRTLYDSAVELSGMSSTSSHVDVEAASAASAARFHLQLDDIGARTDARGQVSIDTSKRVAAVWNDVAPAFHVDLSVAEWSEVDPTAVFKER